MDYKLELVLIPVSDVDRAKTFYVEMTPGGGKIPRVETPIGGSTDGFETTFAFRPLEGLVS